MDYFHYIGSELWCEEVPVTALVQEVGTPVYIYSNRTLVRHFDVFDDAFADVPHIVCFSTKSNSNIAILKTLVQKGAGVDIVSGGELYRAMRAGVDPRKIVYSGVGKKEEEIRYAVESDILMFNVESSEELVVIDACARAMDKKARISLRVNPDVDPMTHPHISTGLKENKFGIDINKSLDEYKRARLFKNIDIVGVDCHIGSQITEITPFLDALDRLKRLIGLLRAEGINIGYLDLGGGLGITYDEETPPHPTEYAAAIIERAGDLDCTFVFEPGRVIIGNAGMLVTQVLYRKESDEKHFVIVDAGMNDLIRPSLYESYHQIQPVIRTETETISADVVGPICESADFLAKQRMIPDVHRGDLLAVMSAGAYGFTMSSNYNSRPRVAEVLVKDDRYYVIRERETYEDIVRGEKIPEYLRG